MVQYFPVVTGSLTVTGSINVSGGITASGGISISGSIASASFASTSSFVALAQSASNAVAAATASFANAFTVAGNLTAQTLVVQTITSSVDFVTGSTRFGSILANTHVFTGSMSVSGSGNFADNILINNAASLSKLSIKGSGSTTGLDLYVFGTNATLSNQDNGSLVFQTNGTDRLTISSAGAATFSSSITATQGIFTLSTNGGAIGSVKNLILLNSSEAIGNWSGINFSYSNSSVNFGYIGTVITTDVNNSLADLVFGVKASNSVTAITEYMRIKGGGNVGIGNSNPLTKLVVNNAITGAILPYINGTGLSYNNDGISVAGSNTGNTNIGNGLTLYNNVASVGAYSPVIAFSSMTSGGAYNATYAFITGIYQGVGGDTNWSKGDLMFGTGTQYGAQERMRIAANGDITWGSSLTSSTKNIYWSEAAGEFQLNGGVGSNSVGATGATLRIGNNTTSARRFWSIQLDGSNQFGTWYYAEGVGWTKVGYQTTGGTWTNSDERRKENISLLNYGLGEVLQLTPKIFNFKNDEFKKPQMGFIAQDVLSIIPEAVQADIDDAKEYYAMNYSNLVPVLVKALQELNTKFEEYKATHP